LLKYSDFSEDSWSGSPSVLIAYGDGFESTEVIRKAKGALKKNSQDIVFEKFALPDHQLSDALEQYKVFGLFGEQRCVEFGTDKAISSKENKDTQYSEQSALSEITKIEESSNFLLIQIKSEDGNNTKFLKKLENVLLVDCSIARETKTSLKNWLITSSKERNLKLTTDGAFELIERIGKNRNNLEKSLTLMELSADASKPWDKKQIQDFFAEELEHAVFDLSDAIGELNLKKSLHLMNWFIHRGTAAPELVGILRFQFKNLLKCKEEQNIHNKVNLDNFAKKSKLPRFVCEKNLKQATKYNLIKLKKIYTELFNLDRDLKSLKLNDKDQIEMFILRLFFA
jgi:DNA polymerase III delta subunit